MKNQFNKLTKIQLIIFLATFIGSVQNANCQTFSEKNAVINLGVGLLPTWYSGNSWFKTTVPQTVLIFDYGIKEAGRGVIGVGAYLGYAAKKGSLGPFEFKGSFVSFGVRGSYHYEFVDKLDTYVGLMLGFRIATITALDPISGVKASRSDFGSNDFNSKLAYSFFVGARYYFSNNFAAFGELGYGVNVLTVGLSYKL